MAQHNPFSYLAFIIYIKQKDIEDCSGLEKFVKECLAKNDIGFFPNTTEALKEKGIIAEDN